jgi:DNA repair exonuclease SbcCD ATPase subunit
MGETFEQLLDIVKAKAEALADALNHESEIEDDRAAIKADAIVRIMARDKIAATPAEKIVETDEEYFKHRATQRASIVARFRAEAEYEAAKAAATRASVITPSMVELQAKNAGLEKDLKQAKREVDLREIALRRANGYLAERIQDVENLQRDISQLESDVAELQRIIDRADKPAGSGKDLSPAAVNTFDPFASDPRD